MSAPVIAPIPIACCPTQKHFTDPTFDPFGKATIPSIKTKNPSIKTKNPLNPNQKTLNQHQKALLGSLQTPKPPHPRSSKPRPTPPRARLAEDDRGVAGLEGGVVQAGFLRPGPGALAWGGGGALGGGGAFSQPWNSEFGIWAWSCKGEVKIPDDGRFEIEFVASSLPL